MKRILASASSGGHWIQLMRLVPAFSGNQVLYISTAADLGDLVPGAKFIAVPDANFGEKLSLIKMAFHVFWITLKYRPHVVVSTGAAIGFFSLVVGKAFGAKTIWIDSIANAERMSLAGSKIRFFADIWLTQWPELASKEGPSYFGSVL